jgi:ATP-dependent protease ClpP protease subunit
MRPCYVFNTAASADKPALLSIYDEIGFWGVQAKDFRDSLSAITAQEIDVEINSPGGDYFAGLAMYNMLRSSGKAITTRVMGVAASAASIVFMAGTKRVMPDNTFLMVHNPSNYGGGTAQEHRDTADMLDKIAIGARAVYARDSGMADDAIATMLENDTWISAAEALDMGLVTEVAGAITATAKFDTTRAELPAAVMAVFALASQTDPGPATTPATPEPKADPVVDPVPDPVADQIVEAATQAGLVDYAPVFVLACSSLDDAKTRISSAREITALCKAVKRPDDAAQAIKAGQTLAQVRAQLAAAMASADPDIDTARLVNQQTTTHQGKPAVTSASVWASHKGQK